MGVDARQSVGVTVARYQNVFVSQSLVAWWMGDPLCGCHIAVGGCHNGLMSQWVSISVDGCHKGWVLYWVVVSVVTVGGC